MLNYLLIYGEALFSICHIVNRIPLKKNKVSSHETWKWRKSDIGYSKIWGCLAYYNNTNFKRNKLGPRSVKFPFIGYASNSKFYRLLKLESNIIIELRDMELF